MAGQTALMKTAMLVTGAVAAAVAVAVSRARARREPDNISGEVAIVTGASRGLGLLLARELARHSCRLVITARDAAELDGAAGQLRAAGTDVVTVACDLSDAASPQRLIDTALDRYGRVDILINNAGLIQVGPLENTEASDYESALAVMALAPVRSTLAALPVMRRQAHGRIVTITSIGGKVSVPHLLPYSVAKFAALGFSEGLRTELGRDPITVTTVVPGLMRTGSHLHASFNGRSGEEFTWFSLGASLPLVSMDAERAAAQIVAAVRSRRGELILTPLGQVVARGAAIMPELTSEILHLVHRMLPAPGGRAGEAVPGKDARPAISPAAFSWLTRLGEAAARRFNEVPPDRPAAMDV